MDKNIFMNADKLEVFNTEKLDEVMVVVTPSAWIMKVVAIIIMIMLCSLLMNYSIEKRIEITGILISKNSIQEVRAPISGIINNINIFVGKKVKKDELLAEIVDINGKKHIVKADFDGLVLNILIDKSDNINSSDKLFVIEKNSLKADIQGIFFLPYNEKHLVEIGDDIKIFTLLPKSTNKVEIAGKIASISKYPANYESLKNLIASSELIKTFLKDGSNVTFIANLSNKGQDIKVGDFCTAKVIQNRKKLIDLMISK